MFDSVRMHDLDRAILGYKEPMQAEPINYPSAHLFGLSPVLRHVGERDAMPDVLLAHALQQLAKAGAEVESDCRCLALCLNVPCVASDWVSTKQIHMG